MDNSASNSEKLVQYFDGDMNEQEKKEFEKILSSDKQLQNELQNLQLSKTLIHSYGLKQKVNALHKTMMQELKEETPVVPISKRKKIIRYSMGVAAGVLLIFIGVQLYQFFGLSPDKLYHEKYTSFELSTTRSGGGLSPIEEAYQDKNYRKVVELTTSAAELNIKDEFLEAMSYAELNDPNSAIKYLKDIINKNEKSGQNIYKDESEFYLALSYLKNKNYEQALQLMTAIHNDAGHLYRDKFPISFIRKVKMLKWR